jgi:hypothetical protein
MTASSIPGAIDALVALAQGAVAADVQVSDGPPQSLDKQKLVVIGYVGPNGEAAVSAVEDQMGLSTVNDMETYEIACQVSSWAGNGTIKALRDAVFTIYNAIASALELDSRLGGAVIRARVGQADYAPSITDALTVVADFRVHVEAMRR